MDEQHTSVVGTLTIWNEFWSPQLENARPILIHLPWGYEQSEARYPVLYMHDGQNLFNQAWSFGEEWQVDETLEALDRRGLQAIVVGIPNAGEARLDEYSPFVDATHGGGRVRKAPSIAGLSVWARKARYCSPRPEREQTGILGSSMGGLISLYAYFQRPDLFGFCGAMSPALWFGGRQIFEVVAAASPLPGRIYLDIGTDEGDEALVDARRMQELLQGKGYGVGRELLYLEEPGAGHSEAEWADRLYGALRFFMRPAAREAS